MFKDKFLISPASGDMCTRLIILKGGLYHYKSRANHSDFPCEFVLTTS